VTFWCIFRYVAYGRSEPGNSVSIVSGYGLDHRAIEVRFPAEAKRIFPVASVSRSALGPTQPPVQWVPGVLSPELKRGRSVTLTTHPLLVPNSRMCRSYTQASSWHVVEQLFNLLERREKCTGFWWESTKEIPRCRWVDGITN
jgi:hypothetical protein